MVEDLKKIREELKLQEEVLRKQKKVLREKEQVVKNKQLEDENIEYLEKINNLETQISKLNAGVSLGRENDRLEKKIRLLEADLHELLHPTPHYPNYYLNS